MAEVFELRKQLEIEDLTGQVEGWVLAAPGEFSVSDLDLDMDFKDRIQRHNRTIALERLVSLGVIERVGNRRGWYRPHRSQLDVMDFKNAKSDKVWMWLPFGLPQLVEIMPGNIITIAGEKNSGKTAILLNIVKENRHDWKIHYFNSEMDAGELKKRLEKFDILIDKWNFDAYRRDSDFADVIFPGPGNLNVIDFLECHDEFYKMGQYIKDIHNKLNGAVCIIALQKNPGQDDGLGGRRSTEKSRLALAVSPGKLKIVAGKNWASDVNPNGLQVNFKLVQGCQLIKDKRGWYKERKGEITEIGGE